MCIKLADLWGSVPTDSCGLELLFEQWSLRRSLVMMLYAFGADGTNEQNNKLTSHLCPGLVESTECGSMAVPEQNWE